MGTHSCSRDSQRLPLQQPTSVAYHDSAWRRASLTVKTMFPRKALRAFQPVGHQCRHYSMPRQPDDTAPPPWPSSEHPTPYEIFAINKVTPYNKKRFYQLVKLYHPDLKAPAHSKVPPEVRVERYRLIVAANTLLSDPDKRRAYDLHGVGWLTRSSLRSFDKAWRYQPGNASANATWEDWERWHQARGEAPAPRQGTVYMPNSIFAMLIAMTVMVGAMVQGQRAETSGAQYLSETALRHQAVGNEVRRSTMASAGMNKDERIGRFLRDRENVTYQFAPSKFEAQQEQEEEEGNR